MLKYLSHRAAALARRKLIPGHSYIFENEIEKVDWAEPENEVDEETMSKVKILFLRNLTPNVSEAELESIFENASNGPVERVKKAKAFAFIHFKTRDQAELAFVNIKNCGLYLDGQEVLFPNPNSAITDSVISKYYYRATETAEVQMS